MAISPTPAVIARPLPGRHCEPPSARRSNLTDTRGHGEPPRGRRSNLTDTRGHCEPPRGRRSNLTDSRGHCEPPKGRRSNLTDTRGHCEPPKGRRSNLTDTRGHCEPPSARRSKLPLHGGNLPLSRRRNTTRRQAANRTHARATRSACPLIPHPPAFITRPALFSGVHPSSFRPWLIGKLEIGSYGFVCYTLLTRDTASRLPNS